MTKTLILSILLVATVPRAYGAPPAAAKLALPAEVAGYREWSQLLAVPYEVPMELYVRCMAPLPKDWEAAGKKYGPHVHKFIRVYGNDAAYQALLAKRPLPVGAVIAKEKFVGSPHGPADGVAFMVKRSNSQFSDSGGWEFLYFQSIGDAPASTPACASCHRTAQATDYIFGRYPGGK